MTALLERPVPVPGPAPGEESRPAARRTPRVHGVHGVRRVRRIAGQVGTWIVLAVVVEYLVVPQLAGSRNSWHLLLGVHNAWLLLAILLESASLAVYGVLSRALLPQEERPGYGTVLGIDLSTMAASHVVPAGSAVGMGLGYRMLTRAGVSGPAAVFAKATQAVGSAVVLNLILWVALLASIPLHGFSPVYGPVAVAGLVLLGAAAVLLALLLRGNDRPAGALARLLGRLPRLGEDRVHAGVLSAAGHLRAFASDPRRLALTFVLAAANWLLDAGALWACVRAFGHSLGPDGLLVPYGIAAVLAALPITPAGLGLVEASLIPALVGFSTPRGIAILGVLAWRAIAFLLPIPIGGVSYLLLQPPGRRPDPTTTIQEEIHDPDVHP